MFLLHSSCDVTLNAHICLWYSKPSNLFRPGMQSYKSLRPARHTSTLFVRSFNQRRRRTEFVELAVKVPYRQWFFMCNKHVEKNKLQSSCRCCRYKRYIYIYIHDFPMINSSRFRMLMHFRWTTCPVFPLDTIKIVSFSLLCMVVYRKTWTKSFPTIYPLKCSPEKDVAASDVTWQDVQILCSQVPGRSR